MSFFPLIYPFCPLALLRVVRILPALVGGPRWTLGHEASFPTVPPRLAFSLSRTGRQSSAGPSFSFPPPGTAIRKRWLPAMQWVPASPTSHSTHSHGGSWPAFLVSAAWRPEEAFSVSCGEVSFPAGPRSWQSLGIIRWGCSSLGIKVKTEGRHESLGFSWMQVGGRCGEGAWNSCPPPFPPPPPVRCKGTVA